MTDQTMRVFPVASSKQTPTMQELAELMNGLPVIEVKPRRRHLAGPREWDDCDDCTELRAVAEDVNREAQMTREEIRENWEQRMAELREAMGR